MVQKKSIRNKINKKFLKELFYRDIHVYNDGRSFKKPKNEVEKYFNNIYYDWENVVNNKLKEIYKYDPKVQEILNMPELNSSEKINLLYKYVYDIEKVKFDEEFKTSFDYFEKYFSKKYFEELYKRYYNTDPEIEKILNDKITLADYKTKLILIRLYKILVEEFKHKPTIEKLYLKLGNKIEDEFKKADDFFKNKFRYSGEMNYSKFMENIIEKYKSNKVVKEIKQMKGISDDTKSILTLIYIKSIVDVPSTKNVEQLIKKSIDKMTSFSVYIPYLLNKEQMKEKLNYDYSEALGYFSSKYSIKQNEKIDNLIERYKDHPNVTNIIDVKQLLVSLKQLDEEETKALNSMKKLITEYYDIIPINRIIEDNIGRYSQQIQKLLSKNKYEYKGFNIYRFFLNHEVEQIIKAYTIYKGEIQRIKDDKDATEKAKKDAEDALKKAKKIEKDKLSEDNLNDKYNIAKRYFEITYPNTKYERSEKLSKLENDYFERLFQYERNKRLSKLENDYFVPLIHKITYGMQVGNYWYKDLETNPEHYEKVKIIFLCEQDLFDKKINENYETAMKYFENKYRIPKYTKEQLNAMDIDKELQPLCNKLGIYDCSSGTKQELVLFIYHKLVNFDPVENKINELEKKYNYRGRYYDYYYYPTDEIKKKYLIYSYYLIDSNIGSFSDLFRYIKGLGDYYGSIFGYLLDSFLSLSLYPLYNLSYLFDKRWWYKNKYYKPFGPSEIEKLLEANTNFLIATKAENNKINLILDTISRQGITQANDINKYLKDLYTNYDEFQIYFKKVIKDYDENQKNFDSSFIENVINKINSIAACLIFVKDSITNSGIKDIKVHEITNTIKKSSTRIEYLIEELSSSLNTTKEFSSDISYVSKKSSATSSAKSSPEKIIPVRVRDVNKK